MKGLIEQLTFGWDTTIGVWGFVLASFVFHEPASLWMLAIAGFCAYLPDLDLIPFLALRKRLNITVGHWVIGHYPLIVLPVEAFIVASATAIIWPEHVAYVTAMALACTTLHFVHDSTNPAGFHLLAPFTKDGTIRFPIPWTNHHPMDLYDHWRIGWGGLIKKAPEYAVRDMYAKCAQLSEGGDEIGGRVENVTRAQLIVSMLGSGGIGALIAFNGYQLPF